MGTIPNHVQKSLSDIFAKRSTMINDVKITEAYTLKPLNLNHPQRDTTREELKKNTRSGFVDDSHISWFHYFFAELK